MSEPHPPPPGGGSSLPVTPPQPLSDAETRQWAGLAHLLGILGFLPSLIIYLVYKDRSVFVGQEARAALNFQITLVLAHIANQILNSVLPAFYPGGLATTAIWIVGLVFSVIGFQTVNKGQAYKYPFSLELVK